MNVLFIAGIAVVAPARTHPESLASLRPSESSADTAIPLESSVAASPIFQH